MKHALRMILGCTLPLLLLFLLPLLGIGEGVTLFIAILLMFACHLFMTHGHDHGTRKHAPTQGDSHAHHQH